MESREWKVGLVGTFDVENYGDLLFPLLARAELTARLGKVDLRCFSYAAKTEPEWPFPVTSVTELPRLVRDLDALILGGGFLIRFDKNVAAGYGPPTPGIHHPTGFWLSPALLALQHGTPLLWNTPGVSYYDGIPGWAAPLMELTLRQSAYLAVRDEPSRAALARFVDRERIEVVPDSAFGVGRLLAARPPGESAAEAPGEGLRRLREACGLAGSYVLVQCVSGMGSCLEFLARHAERLRGIRLVALPVGPVNGDRVELLGDHLSGLVRLPSAPSAPKPLLLAELIRNAEAVVGPSFHLAITALTAGVPVFSQADLSLGKFPGLAGLPGIHPLPAADDEPGPFFDRLGRRPVAPRVDAAIARVGVHWDRIADAIRKGSTASPIEVGRFWQSLPTALEEAEERRLAVEAELATSRRLLALARSEIAKRDRRIADLLASTSWKATGPLRSVARRFRR